MTKAAITKLKKLPRMERIEIVDELIQSLALEHGEIPVTDDERAMIDKGLAEIEKHPNRGISLADFRKELKTLSRRMRAGVRRKSA